MGVNFVSRFYTYQKERFPVAVLFFTTLSVVLSSFIVVLEGKGNITGYIPEIVLAFLVCLLFTFHIRVLDEHKDFTHDNNYHKYRPIQRGLISLKELDNANLIGITIQIILVALYSLINLVYWAIAFSYSLLGKFDFFIKNLRQHFIFYNLMNLMQMFFLQIFLYSLISHPILWHKPILYVHFVYFLLNVLTLEVARKMKTKKDESRGKDTYTSRYGIKNACLMYTGVFVAANLLLVWLLLLLNVNYLYYIMVFVLLLYLIISTLLYYYRRTYVSSISLQLGAVFFYVCSDIILILTNVLK